MSNNLTENLGPVTLAIGALGTAAFGIVDGLKLFPWVDLAGFERLFSGQAGGRHWVARHRAGIDALLPALKIAYGSDVMGVLKAQYRAARSSGDLPRTLRQGVRIGLGMMSAEEIRTALAGIGIPADTAQLAAEALVKARGQRPPAAGDGTPPPAPVPLSDDERAAIARVETTIDARIDAALVLANTQYATQSKALATVVALAIAFGVGHLMAVEYGARLLVGLVAVPIAPVAKDLASGLQAAVTVFGKK